MARRCNYYGTARWARLQAATLARDGWTCQMCGAMLRGGRSDRSNSILRPAAIDHLMPHQGSEALFFDPENVWAVSADMHDSVCQAIEAKYAGDPLRIVAEKLKYRFIGLDGYPVSPPERWVDRHWSSKLIRYVVK